jgi:uncharacterized ParB-like nuclease family protein
MRVGLLTGGGDCPGLNAVIRAVVRKGEVEHGDTFVGFRDGWKGLTENLTRPLDVEACRGILPRGGTILGTSRTNPYKVEGGVEAVRATLRQTDVDALVAIGGEDTLGVACRLSQDGVQVVGVPKTIDNDLSATDVTRLRHDGRPQGGCHRARAAGRGCHRAQDRRPRVPRRSVRLLRLASTSRSPRDAARLTHVLRSLRRRPRSTGVAAARGIQSDRRSRA